MGKTLDIAGGGDNIPLSGNVKLPQVIIPDGGGSYKSSSYLSSFRDITLWGVGKCRAPFHFANLVKKENCETEIFLTDNDEGKIALICSKQREEALFIFISQIREKRKFAK